jgi:hypothetical protein
MERDGFVFYKSFAEAIGDLQDDVKLECLNAIIDYGIYGIERELSGIPAIVFKLVKPQLDANNKRFSDGKKGGRPKKTDGLENKNQWFSDEKPKEKEKEKVKEKEKEKVKEKVEIDYQGIIDLYNEICVSLPRVTKLSDSRKRAIKTRLKSYTVEDLKKAFEMAEASDFISGRNGKWNNASFDWLMNETNLVKVLDGNYKNKTSGKIEVDNNLRQFIANNQVVDFGM